MKKLFLFSLLVASVLPVAVAQDISVTAPYSSKSSADSVQPSPDGAMATYDMKMIQTETGNISKNFVKLNLTSIAILNFSLQYERVLSRSVSGALAFAYRPEMTIPTYIADPAIKQIDNNSDDGIGPETEDIIRNLLISSYTITPEVRFYLGKKRYSTGFYISLFYRYGSYSFSNIPIPFTNDLDEDITIETKGDIKSHTGGFMLGYQWALGNRMCLDLQIFGPHFGVSSGDLLGLPSSPLLQQDQADIEEEFLIVDVSLIDQSVIATANDVKMTLNGPWGGIRAGLSFGIKF